MGLILCLLGASLLFRWGGIYLNHVVYFISLLYILVMVGPKFIIIVETDDFKIRSTFSILFSFYYKIIINFVLTLLHAILAGLGQVKRSTEVHMRPGQPGFKKNKQLIYLSIYN